MRKVLCFILAIIMLALTACKPRTPQDKVKVFDEVCSLLEQRKKIRISDDDSLDKNLEQIEKKLIALGLKMKKDGWEPLIGQDFIDAYLIDHTVEELFANFYQIYYFRANAKYESFFADHIYEDDWHKSNSSDCDCQRYSAFWQLILDNAGLDAEYFDTSMRNKSGYYTDHPEADPQPFTDESSGRFFNQYGEYISTETATNTGIVEYYGDFAVLDVTRYNYSEGSFEWVNGQLHDTLPHWNKIHFCELYYKGVRLIHADTFNEISSGNFKVVCVGDKIYQVSTMSIQPLDAYDDPKGDVHTFLMIAEIKPSE